MGKLTHFDWAIFYAAKLVITRGEHSSFIPSLIVDFPMISMAIVNSCFDITRGFHHRFLSFSNTQNWYNYGKIHHVWLENSLSTAIFPWFFPILETMKRPGSWGAQPVAEEDQAAGGHWRAGRGLPAPIAGETPADPEEPLELSGWSRWVRG